MELAWLKMIIWVIGSWEGLMLATDISTTSAETIFQVLTLKMASAEVVET